MRSILGRFLEQSRAYESSATGAIRGGDRFGTRCTGNPDRRAGNPASLQGPEQISYGGEILDKGVRRGHVRVKSGPDGGEPDSNNTRLAGGRLEDFQACYDPACASVREGRHGSAGRTTTLRGSDTARRRRATA